MICLVTDRRTYMDRRNVWAEEKKAANFVAERPKAKIKQISESTEETVPRRTPRAAPRQKSEEKHEEELVQIIFDLEFLFI